MLKVGDNVPNFSGIDQHNNKVDFINFKIKSSKLSLIQNLVFFGLTNGLSLSLLLKILKINDFKFFKMNWFRICN